MPAHAGNQGDIGKAEAYLQNLSTARARFVQTAHGGKQYVGTFYLDRPGKLRFEYDPPVEDFIVADGIFIYFYDAELQEQTNAPIAATLANFFLRDDLELGDDLEVTKVWREDEELNLTVIQEGEPEDGSLTLAFKENPLTLSSWSVVDPQGYTTKVELFYLKTGITHPSGLFIYNGPDKAGTFND